MSNDYKTKLRTLLTALEYQNIEEIMEKSNDEIRFLGELLIYTYKINMGIECIKPVKPNIKYFDVQSILKGEA